MEGLDLYDCPMAELVTFNSRSEWLEGRLEGIGGSDAAAAMNMNRWETARDLWAVKTRREVRPDISNNPNVKYGAEMEPLIRASFALDYHERYMVQYLPDVMLVNRHNPNMFYSPDGLIYDRETGESGIFEAKTHLITDSADYEKWKDGIGYDEYFIQVLHGMNVTGYSFVALRAELRWSADFKITKTYFIKKTDEGVLDQMGMIWKETTSFWKNNIAGDVEPPVIAYI